MHLNFTDRASSVGKLSTSQTTSPAVANSKTSSLARAFTTSVRNKDKDAAQMGRSSSQRAPIKASQISLPVALISTTNMLSYDAPDLPGAPLSRVQKQSSTYQLHSKSPQAPSVSSASPSDVDSLRSRHSNASTAATSLSVEGFASPESPEQNHLTCYFKPNSQAQSPSQTSLQSSRADSVLGSPYTSPQIPSRATSHSKQAHVMSHKRSMGRGVLAASNQHTITARDSTDLLRSATLANTSPRTNITATIHPFGKELEQLNEIAEEFSSTVRDAEAEADFRVLKSKGLGSFCAAEYMQEIAPLFNKAYAEDLTAAAPTWI